MSRPLKEVLCMLVIMLALLFANYAWGMGDLFHEYHNLLPEAQHQQCEGSKVLKYKFDFRGTELYWIDDDCDGVCDYGHMLRQAFNNGEFIGMYSMGPYTCEDLDSMWELYLKQQEMYHGWYNFL